MTVLATDRVIRILCDLWIFFHDAPMVRMAMMEAMDYSILAPLKVATPKMSKTALAALKMGRHSQSKVAEHGSVRS